MNIVAKTQTLLDLTNGVNVLVDEAKIELTPEGLSFRAMDPSHIAMISVDIPSSDFSTYEVAEKTAFGIRTDELAKMLKRYDKEGEVKVDIADNQLVVSNGSKTYKTHILDLSDGLKTIPKVTFTAKVEGNREAIAKALADVKVSAEHVVFTVKNETFELSGKGDTGEVSVFPETDNRGFEGEGSSTYSLDYLLKMINAVKSTVVVMEFSSKMPLKLSLGRISYFLAPRVQE